jgi:predicted amidohydrolase
MRVATIPLPAKPFEWEQNTQLAWQAIQENSEADLVLLPELFAAGYCYDRRVRQAAEFRDGTTIEWMQAASQAFDTVVGGTFIERVGNRIFNTFALVGPSQRTHFYRKTAIPPLERFYFHGGSDHGIFDTPLGRIGVLICWDITSPAAIDSMRGNVDLVLIPMAWPDTTNGNIGLPWLGRHLARQPVEVPARIAAELDVPVVVCNMGGAFKSRVPGTLVTYSSSYVNSSGVIQPTSGAPNRIAANGQALVVDLGSSRSVVRKRRVALAVH